MNIKKANDYLFQFRSFSTITDLVENAESNFQTVKKCQYDRFKQMLIKIENFHKSIDQIPNFSISVECIMLNMMEFKKNISSMPSTALNNIHEVMIKFLKNESDVLYQELINYIQVFSSDTAELTQFIEKSNAYRKLKKNFPSLEKKVDNLETVASFFDSNVLSQMPSNSRLRGESSFPSKSVVISESIMEVRKCLDLLPELFIKVKNGLEHDREDLATKVIETSQELLRKIEQFEDAYIENFHRKASTKKAKDIFINVQAKSKTFNDIQEKSDLFKDCLTFLKAEGDLRVIEMFPDLEQFE